MITQQVVRKRLCHIKPSPENDKLYRPINVDDPEILKLAASIKKNGLLEPIVITEDRFIISGHRRYVAATIAGQKTVPCRVIAIKRKDDIDAFVELLREHNLQREKTLSEKLREESVSIDPHEAYASLIAHRSEAAQLHVSTVGIVGIKGRSEISEAKSEMMVAIEEIVFVERKKFWPMSVRAIHYALLNHQPLRNINRPESQYVNDRKCYQDLSNLLTRARLAGVIPWEAICDETRPLTTWQCWQNAGTFFSGQLDGFMKNYWRDLMQSQPNHIEVIAEKNTVYSIITDVTGKYCIPTFSGRGFSSIQPYHDLAGRFNRSGKDRLVLLIVSDFDPEGEEIVQVAGRTLRDDFEINDIELIKVAVTSEQVDRFDLPPDNEAKETSSRYQKFVDRHGENVYELEALRPETLQDELTEAIDSVIDIAAFNAELDAEKRDAAFLEGVRKTVQGALKDIDFESAHPDSD